MYARLAVKHTDKPVFSADFILKLCINVIVWLVGSVTCKDNSAVGIISKLLFQHKSKVCAVGFIIK